jgi:hypothetical protein
MVVLTLGIGYCLNADCNTISALHALQASLTSKHRQKVDLQINSTILTILDCERVWKSFN